MRVVLQRVKRAEVRVDSRVTGSIGPGFLVLAGFSPTDTDLSITWMAEKILGLRVFGDDEGKMNRDLADVGEVAIHFALVVAEHPQAELHRRRASHRGGSALREVRR